MLLDAGAPVRGRDAAKQTLLHHAARGGNVAAIEMLLQRGALADINTADKWSRMPLHWAVLNGHLGAVKALLAQGAEAKPAPVPERVHRRRTSLISEDPIQLATRVHGRGLILEALLAACPP
jgi:ankyrin repeat protein